MADQPTIDAYNRTADEYASRNFVPVENTIYADVFPRFVVMAGEGKRLLELGCGIGRDAHELVRLGFIYTGIDPSDKMLAIAREHNPAADLRIGDFFKMEFPDASFDCFWAAASLLHVPKSNIGNVLEEISRVLKNGGVGFISIKEKKDLDEGYIKEEKGGGIERYFSFYTEDEFSRILKGSGFSIVSAEEKIEHEGTRWLCFFVRSV